MTTFLEGASLGRTLSTAAIRRVALIVPALSATICGCGGLADGEGPTPRHSQGGASSSFEPGVFEMGEGGAGPPQDEPHLGPRSQTQTIVAEEGGELVLGGSARVTIPPGALSADAEVTFERTCEGVYTTARFESCGYRVVASGAELLAPLQLAFPLKPGISDAEGCPAELGEDGFRCTPGAFVGGMFVTPGTAFTTYVGLVAPDILDHRVLELPFRACGGEITGAWVLVQTSASFEQATDSDSWPSSPYEVCGDLHFYRAFPFSLAGPLQFERGGCDEFPAEDCTGTWIHDEHEELARHEIVSDACLDDLGVTCHPDCVHTGGACECLWAVWSFKLKRGGVWDQLDEETLSFDNEVVPYCVDGESLRLLRGGDSPYVQVYQRD